MPYTLESLMAKAQEPCVLEWMSQLNPNTKNYAYYFLKFYDWFRAKGAWEKPSQAVQWKSAREMLDEWERLEESEDKKLKRKVPKVVHSFILAMRTKQGKRPGISERRNAWCAVADFFDYHELPLPSLTKKVSDKLFAPSEVDEDRELEQEKLTIEEVEKLISKVPSPYDVALIVMFQGFMGLAEFSKFNTKAWRKILKSDPKAFEKPGPLRINIFRSKTSRGRMASYYTFISNDAKKAVSDWLKVRPQTKHPHLLVAKRRGQKGKKGVTGTAWVPVTSRLIGQQVTETSKRIGLIQEPPKEERWSGVRYHVHAHEFRDLAKSLSSLHGVRNLASEYFLGHKPSSYEKSAKYDEGWYRRQYQKIESYLNIVSNPSGGAGGLDEARRVAREEFARMRLAGAGYTSKQTEEMDLSEMSVEEVDRLVAERRAANRATDGRQRNGNGGKQKVIPLNELSKWVDDGWELVEALPSIGQAVVREPA